MFKIEQFFVQIMLEERNHVFFIERRYLDRILLSAKALVFCLHAAICNTSISDSQY